MIEREANGNREMFKIILSEMYPKLLLPALRYLLGGFSGSSGRSNASGSCVEQ